MQVDDQLVGTAFDVHVKKLKIMGSNAFDIVTDLHEDWQVVFVLVAAVLAETHDDFLNILAFGDGGSFGDLFTDHSAG